MSMEEIENDERVRRFSDNDLCKKIMGLISEESEQKERTRLLILLQFSNLLIDNIQYIRGMVADIENHKASCEGQLSTALSSFRENMKKLNTLRTGSTYASYFMAALIALCSVIYTDRVNELHDVADKYEGVSKELKEVRTDLARIQAVMDAYPDRKNSPNPL
jgi:hypothetical protein